MLMQAAYFIANWYACIGIVAAACCFRIGKHQWLTFVIAMFAVLNWLIHDLVYLAGAYPYYLIWSGIELFMVVTFFAGFYALKLRPTAHLAAASVMSFLFVLVNGFRFVDRFYGNNEFAASFNVSVLIIYVIYSFIICSPLIGLALVFSSSKLKGFLQNDYFSIFGRVGRFLITGCLRRDLVRKK